MKRILCFAISVGLTFAGCSKATPEKEEVSISDDPIFNEYCQQFDADGDGILSRQESEAVTEMSIDDVASLDGIEQFPNLEQLTFTGMGISSIDISKNQKLTHLGFGRTSISALDISNNSSLRYLSFIDNKFSNQAIKDVLNALPIVPTNPNQPEIGAMPDACVYFYWDMIDLAGDEEPLSYEQTVNLLREKNWAWNPR